MKGGFNLKPFFNKLSQICQQGYHHFKNKAGFSNLELTIMALILIVLISGIADFSKTATADSSVSPVINYIAETIAEQGGLNTTAPEGYKGTYTTSAKLLANIKQSMDSIGVPEDRWQLYIDTEPSNPSNDLILVRPNTNTGTFDYKSEIDILFKYQNGFDLLELSLPGKLPTLNRTTARHVITTYYERTGSDVGYE